MANKIKYGIKNCYYAKVTSTSAEGALTYDTPVALPGAVSISLAAQGSSNPFYADNVVYWKGTANNGYEGDLTLALIPDAFRKDILGETEDAKGFFVERATDNPIEFALLFQFEGDENATRHAFYRCTASRSSVEGNTKEDAITPQTEAITISAMPRINDEVIKARCPYSSSTSSSYALWFDAVQEPTAA